MIEYNRELMAKLIQKPSLMDHQLIEKNGLIFDMKTVVLKCVIHLDKNKKYKKARD
jgi:hypothetical protein